jgi:hypothetical protein
LHTSLRLPANLSKEELLMGSPRRRWLDNMKMDLREIGWDDMDWIDVAQSRGQWKALVNPVIYLRVP